MACYDGVVIDIRELSAVMVYICNATGLSAQMFTRLMVCIDGFDV
jgi:hypothetical protein